MSVQLQQLTVLVNGDFRAHGASRFANRTFPSPSEKTVVLGVTSRSRDGLKGKAHSCDSLARSVRSSSRGRSRWPDLWSPMFSTQTRFQAQPQCVAHAKSDKRSSSRQQADAESQIILQLRKRKTTCVTEREVIQQRSITNKMGISRKNTLFWIYTALIFKRVSGGKSIRVVPLRVSQSKQ